MGFFGDLKEDLKADLKEDAVQAQTVLSEALPEDGASGPEGGQMEFDIDSLLAEAERTAAAAEGAFEAAAVPEPEAEGDPNLDALLAEALGQAAPETESAVWAEQESSSGYGAESVAGADIGEGIGAEDALAGLASEGGILQESVSEVIPDVPEIPAEASVQEPAPAEMEAALSAIPEEQSVPIPDPEPEEPVDDILGDVLDSIQIPDAEPEPDPAAALDAALDSAFADLEAFSATDAEEPEPVQSDAAAYEAIAALSGEANATNETYHSKGVYEMDERDFSEETSVITGGMSINGDVTTEGSLELIGSVAGNVDVTGKLNVTGHIIGNSKAKEIFAENAKITGDVTSESSVKIGTGTVIIGNISAFSAAIAGAVKGDIDVHGPVILDSTAIVMGNIRSKSVQINNGAAIEGNCSQCYADVSPTSFFDEYKPERKPAKSGKKGEKAEAAAEA